MAPLVALFLLHSGCSSPASHRPLVTALPVPPQHLSSLYLMPTLKTRPKFRFVLEQHPISISVMCHYITDHHSASTVMPCYFIQFCGWLSSSLLTWCLQLEGLLRGRVWDGLAHLTRCCLLSMGTPQFPPVWLVSIPQESSSCSGLRAVHQEGGDRGVLAGAGPPSSLSITSASTYHWSKQATGQTSPREGDAVSMTVTAKSPAQGV